MVVVSSFMALFLNGFVAHVATLLRSASLRTRSVSSEVKHGGGRCSPLVTLSLSGGSFSLILLLVIHLFIFYSPPFLFSQEKPLTWEVYFSPRGGATDAMVRELNSAKKTIMVQAYSFTSSRIASALLNAHKRGVKVEVVLDKKQRTDKYSSATFLFNQGIPVKIDSRHAANHNKVMIIDEEIVITGSFNFTRAAEEGNAENLLVIRDRKLTSLYLKNFQEHWQHSEVYRPRFK
jgi:phosphatidylserine/phosphatidylglycerophosphate/cardiolipin synthase-like enzyme